MKTMCKYYKAALVHSRSDHSGYAARVHCVAEDIRSFTLCFFTLSSLSRSDC